MISGLSSAVWRPASDFPMGCQSQALLIVSENNGVV